MTGPAARGTTEIAERAVRRIAEQAAKEALIGTGGRVLAGRATVRAGQASVGVEVALPYGGSADAGGEAVGRHVADRTGRLTGMPLSPPRIRVGALSLTGPVPASGTAGAGPGAPTRRSSGRVWSERRLPIAVLAAAVLAAAVLLLRDVVAVHLLHQGPAHWRTRALTWLTVNGPGVPSGAGRVLGAAAVLAGAALLLAAFAPGHRRLLALAVPDRGVRATLGRASAARLVRAAVVEVPGVVHSRVRVGRRRVRVRVRFAFGERRAVEETVEASVTAVVAGLGLARAPRGRVRIRPTAGWRPPEPLEPRPGPAGTPEADEPKEREHVGSA
ncbi:DUF6286 domain-containing protein [Streptomyces sp. NPDC001523]|uniref:DUF6286 domain-containing protein n=1 Tax=Streptomyces sp. NPDC001523 TaxID=3154383 RepID=UPI003319A18D